MDLQNTFDFYSSGVKNTGYYDEQSGQLKSTSGGTLAYIKDPNPSTGLGANWYNAGPSSQAALAAYNAMITGGPTPTYDYSTGQDMVNPTAPKPTTPNVGQEAPNPPTTNFIPASDSRSAYYKGTVPTIYTQQTGNDPYANIQQTPVVQESTASQNPNANFFQPGQGGNPLPQQTPQQQNQAAVTPPSQPAQTYTIQSGDTLSKLAAQYGTTVGALMSLNPQITDANRIYAGQKINLTPTPSTISNTQGIQEGLNAATLQAQAIQQQISSMSSPASSADPITPTTANGQTPTSNFMETYSKVAKELGLSDIKSAYTKALDDSKALEDKKNEEAQNINNNPWYSQGKKQLELQKLDNKYETKLNTLSNYAKLYDSLYQEGIANAEFLTTGIQKEQQFALELAQKKQEAIDELMKSSQKLESGIVGEYQFAVNNGYKGTFSQYQNEDANRKATIARAGATVIPTTQDINTKETSEALGTVNQISDILSDANFEKSFGALGLARTLIPGTPEYTLGAKVQQIKDKLSLAARGQLKGQGQVSNYEGLMLANAQTNLRTGMNPVDARQEFINIQGALNTSTGGKAKVQIKDKSGAVYTVMADSRGITQAIADGLSVKYVQ